MVNVGVDCLDLQNNIPVLQSRPSLLQVLYPHMLDDQVAHATAFSLEQAGCAPGVWKPLLFSQKVNL